MAPGLKGEITTQLLERNVSSFSMAPVKRNCAFERSDIPHGESYVLKISYPFKVSWCKFECFWKHLATYWRNLNRHFLMRWKLTGRYHMCVVCGCKLQFFLLEQTFPKAHSERSEPDICSDIQGRVLHQDALLCPEDEFEYLCLETQLLVDNLRE